MSKLQSWLKELARQKKGPVPLPAIFRGRPWSQTVRIVGEHPSATLRAQIRAMPGAPALLASFDVEGPVVSAGASEFTLSLSRAATSAFPPDKDEDGVDLVAYDIVLSLTGDAAGEETLFGGTIPVVGGVSL